MNPVVLTIVDISVVALVLALPFTFYRVMKGDGVADRILALEMTTGILIGIVILLSIVEGTDTPLDIAIILAALGFAGTLSIARYISEGRVF